MVSADGILIKERLTKTCMSPACPLPAEGVHGCRTTAPLNAQPRERQADVVAAGCCTMHRSGCC